MYCCPKPFFEALGVLPDRYISNTIQIHPEPEDALKILRAQSKPAKIAGKKGDLILWLEALPHAASPNRSSLPRFVQYVSYIKP
ncbi:phytanoyl-CoA dioxygenase family protein [Pedobacter fastidiosus]|uniref:phytanoyl-CoA dioxygenase family protein n=1 Tax=Pedobacter fastidiosus TaxID=2765361 RepID=UPI001C9B0C0D|nr:phytanoyl-CoA dioxygenase family protein [Pedobacter fastidiosus]